MNTFKKYGLFSMALLAGMAVFTACSSDEVIAPAETAPVNPTYDGESVKTQFAINIPRANTNKRMSAANTQNDGKFLGMSNIYLMPMAIASPGDITGTTPITNFIGLGDIATGGLTGTPGPEGYKVYNDVQIPVGSTHFLFYATATATATDMTGKFQHGSLQNTFADIDQTNATPAQITFNLEQISTTKSNQSLLDQLNAVAGASGWSSIATDPAPTGNAKTLVDLRTNFLELKAGSANAIKATLQDLYNAVNAIANDGSDTGNKAIATAIQTAMTTGQYGLFNASAGTNGEYTLAYKTANTFPTDLGLPEGAVAVEWSSTAFTYASTGINIGASGNQVNVDDITYPACLAYYCGTPLKATTSTSPSWDWATGSWSGWTNAVDATTQAVALQNKVNYGVALLKTTVKFAQSSMEDNNKGGTTVPVTNEAFQLTGVLVGGQPNTVQYDMLPSSTQYEKTVYDRDITANTYVTTADMDANYTLLLDNKGNVSGANPASVQFAIELLNNSATTIYGVDGVIRPGMKFYLVGKLDPTDGTGNVDGSAPSVADPHVFMQDYVTTATVTINSLKNAYVTIPDLRSTQMKLGLFVDLTWQTGYNFDVAID